MLQNYFATEVQHSSHIATGISRSGYSESARAVLDESDCSTAFTEISAWDGYSASAVHQLDNLAEHCGVSAVLYKDESSRFGLGSFKALGGAYAVLRLLQHQAAQPTAAADVVVATASDGNHGRSVAWGARRAGCQCRIFIHAEVSDGRAQAMRQLGADVIRIDGDYDESVRQCELHGWQMVSDTSFPGYVEIPQQVMAGYTVFGTEVLQQIDQPPTHVFLQAGVGGLAAAVAARLWMSAAADRPVFTVVESDYSACVKESFLRGAASSVPIRQET